MADGGARRGDRAWPIGLACMLASMIAASLAFLAIAVTHPDAEVVEDAYTAGLAFDEEVALRGRAHALGLSVDLDTRRVDGGVEARVAVTDREGRTLPVEAASLRRIRPTQGGYDRDFDLAPGDGGFAGRVPLPLPGRWRLEARLVVDGQELFALADLWRS